MTIYAVLRPKKADSLFGSHNIV